MDSMMSFVGSSAAPTASSSSAHHHSTAFVSTLGSLAHNSLQDHLNDYADAHRWIDSFFEKLEHMGASNGGGSRPTVTELMKTPGRKRVVGNNSTNRLSTQPSSVAAAKKDPVATLLFPAAHSAASRDKENGPMSPSAASPRRALSPAGPGTGKAAAPLSPMRLASPRPIPATSSTRSQPVALKSPAPANTPAVIARDFAQQQPQKVVEPEEPFHAVASDLSNVMEEDEEEEEEAGAINRVETPVAREEAPQDESGEASSMIAEEEKANLSVIGEEEEDEDNSPNVSAVTAPSTQPDLVATASVTVSEPQFSQPTLASPPLSTILASTTTLHPSIASPHPRTVSAASSVAPEADADESVPLNDDPSTLRSHTSDQLSSSLPASSATRTPGNSSSRFGVAGSYSAVKLGTGSVGLGSSPPPTAPATVGPSFASASARVSTGGVGARQLNFVGLPKKSLGIGLGIGRNWASSSAASLATDSQGSSQGNLVGSSQTTQVTSVAPATGGGLSTQNSFLDSTNPGTATATGATKRKSLSAPDTAHKAAKVSQPTPGADSVDDESRRRREALASRIQSMQARQSTVAAGRTSNMGAGAFGSNLFGAANKPLATSTSSIFQSSMAPSQAPKPAPATLPSATSSVNILAASTADTNSSLARRPSVMERVKSFEHNSTVQDHLHPPSPSKIPAAFIAPGGRSVSPVPPKSPARGLASPTFGLVSPKPLTRSATSGLPLATFLSPKMSTSSSFSPLGSPKPTSAAFRSPPILRAPAPPIPAPATLPLAAVSPPYAPTPTSVRSTTPPDSPPTQGLRSLLQRFDQAESTQPKAQEQKEVEAVVIDDEEEGEETEEEEEEEQDDEYSDEEADSIRPVNPVSPSAAASKVDQDQQRRKREGEGEAKTIAERAARDLEEQEAEREREEVLQKRLPSLPEPMPLTQEDDDEDDYGEDELMSDREEAPRNEQHNKDRSVISTATKEDLGLRTSPSKILMPGIIGAAHVAASSNDHSPPESEAEDDADDEDMDNDRTAMSMMSTATNSMSFSQSQGPFRPVKPSTLAKHGSGSSLSSSVSSTSALGLNRSIGNGATGKKPEPKMVKSLQKAAAAAKKEKEEADRKAALKEEKRLALQRRKQEEERKKQEEERKKQEEERKVKADGLEKKRKERDEVAAKAKANSIRSVKPKDDEPAKKRKVESEVKARPDVKKSIQPSRPLTASTSSLHISSLASSQGRSGAMGPPSNPLSKSNGPSFAAGGASSMIGHKFMSNQIRLPEASSGNAQAGPSRPAHAGPTIPKPFGTASQGAMRPPQLGVSQGAVHRTPAPPKPEPEPYQELPEIDSEYSDSDDEAHEKKVASFPRWAQSPALAHALLEQRKINPDEIFGPIPPLSIQEIFRSNQSAARLRARTSSAQWDGTDALTRTDMERYHRAMGFRSGLHATTNPSASTSNTTADSPAAPSQK
ncbi:hypothetical protein JCM21900_006591 [Sporobolomyces salmonicolor]